MNSSKIRIIGDTAYFLDLVPQTIIWLQSEKPTEGPQYLYRLRGFQIKNHFVLNGLEVLQDHYSKSITFRRGYVK